MGLTRAGSSGAGGARVATLAISHLGAALVVVLGAACGEDDTKPGAATEGTGGGADAAANYSCGDEEGTFRSVPLLDCGPGPTGPIQCHWDLTFTAGQIEWTHEGVTESGSYTCSANELSATIEGTPYTGSIDPASGWVTWEGDVYTR